MLEDFDVTKPPKKEDVDAVGDWAWTAFELSRQWRDDELGMGNIWRDNYKLFHGNHWGTNKKKNDMTVNLFYANIIRTVANVTARHPVSEVVDLDGTAGERAKVATARTKKWWMDTNQQAKLRATVTNSEIYGITWEKSVWSGRFGQPGVVVCDPFAIFPYPGYWEDMATDLPCICHAIPLAPTVVESQFDVKGVKHSETFDLLGGDREEIIGSSTYGANRATTGLQGSVVKTVRSQSAGTRGENALVVEVWCRDLTKKDDGTELYPGGIRCITVTNNGDLVLDDRGNPSLNLAMDLPTLNRNYLFRRFPFYKNNSYIDTSSIFGFSAAEMTAPLVKKIDELMSRIVNYAMRAMTGILVIPEGIGVTRAHLNNKPNLVLFTRGIGAESRIKVIPFPNPPSIIQQTLEMLISLHDRIHAIQDVDRGDTPANITAASAIVALQERNAVLIQHKIDGIDYLVEQRGNYAIAQWQGHGHKEERVAHDNETFSFTGTHLAPFNFNYTVESGSSMPKTSLQIQEQAQALFEKGAIDQRALLENLNFPGWRKIVERMAEGRLEGAMEMLIQAGLPEEQAAQLYRMLMEPQGGPGDTQQGQQQQRGQQAQPGVPRAQQGKMRMAA